MRDGRRGDGRRKWVYSQQHLKRRRKTSRANRSIKGSTERNATRRDVVAMNVKGREAMLGIGGTVYMGNRKVHLVA